MKSSLTVTVIAWFSQHIPLLSQEKELRRLFGDIQIVHIPEPFRNAESILSKTQELGATEIVLVAPYSVIDRVCKAGVKPLFARMLPVTADHPKAEVQIGSRWYCFLRFRRIKGIHIEWEDVLPYNHSSIVRAPQRQRDTS